MIDAASELRKYSPLPMPITIGLDCLAAIILWGWPFSITAIA